MKTGPDLCMPHLSCPQQGHLDHHCLPYYLGRPVYVTGNLKPSHASRLSLALPSLSQFLTLSRIHGWPLLSPLLCGPLGLEVGMHVSCSAQLLLGSSSPSGFLETSVDLLWPCPVMGKYAVSAPGPLTQSLQSFLPPFLMMSMSIKIILLPWPLNHLSACSLSTDLSLAPSCTLLSLTPFSFFFLLFLFLREDLTM